MTLDSRLVHKVHKQSGEQSTPQERCLYECGDVCPRAVVAVYTHTHTCVGDMKTVRGACEQLQPHNDVELDLVVSAGNMGDETPERPRGSDRAYPPGH